MLPNLKKPAFFQAKVIYKGSEVSTITHSRERAAAFVLKNIKSDKPVKDFEIRELK